MPHGLPDDRLTAAALGDLRRVYRMYRARVVGRPLPRELYLDRSIFELDLRAVFLSGWIFAAHACELPAPGDFVTVESPLGSLIVVRSTETDINAFANVCRHRGFMLCGDRVGKAARFICPYHQWTYALDGTLVHAAEMGAGFDTADFGLRRLRVEVVSGLIFVSWAENGWPFDGVRRGFERLLKPHALEETRIAHQLTYDVATNWKLVVENQRECYHCPQSHPEYVRAHYDADVGRPAFAAEIADKIEECTKRWSALGIDTSTVNASSDYTGSWYRANRTPFRPGFVTESLDGAPVAPMLGALSDADIGTARAGLYTNFWLHATSDHAVTVTYTPLKPMQTRMTATWLVHKEAVEGRDYELDRLLAFSRVQLEQDRVLLNRQGQGIANPGYSPGPYSGAKELNVERFVSWYTKTMVEYLAERIGAAETGSGGEYA